jgi:hypothetical protein
MWLRGDLNLQAMSLMLKSTLHQAEASAFYRDCRGFFLTWLREHATTDTDIS